MIFAKKARTPEPSERDSAPTQTQYSSQLASEGLEHEYEELVRAQIVRLGIPLETVEVEVKPAGSRRDSRKIYLGMVRLTRWNERTSLRLLMALPLLEAKVRQSLDTSWLVDVSHFGGLWLHASSSLGKTTALSDIRDAIVQLEGIPAADTVPPPETGWDPSMEAALEVVEVQPSGPGKP